MGARRAGAGERVLRDRIAQCRIETGRSQRPDASPGSSPPILVGLINPLSAALTMAASSLGVVGNSARPLPVERDPLNERDPDFGHNALSRDAQPCDAQPCVATRTKHPTHKRSTPRRPYAETPKHPHATWSSSSSATCTATSTPAAVSWTARPKPTSS
jgi:hypothetical protein